MASEAMGVSTEKLNDMLENGEVLATDLLPKLAAVLEGRFADAAIDSADSAQAHFNRLKNEVTELKQVVGDSGLIENMTDLAKESRKFLETNQSLISSDLKVFFEVAAGTAKVLLGTVSGIANKLDQIGKFSGWTAEMIHGADTVDKALSDKLKPVEARVRVLRNALKVLGSDTKSPMAVKYQEELNKQLRIRYILYQTIEDQKKKAQDAPYKIDSGQTSGVHQQLYGASVKAEAAMYKIREEMRKRDLDNLGSQQEKKIAKIKDYYARRKSEVLQFFGTGSNEYAEIVTQQEKEITKVKEEYAAKRLKVSTTALNKENKALKTHLKSLISDGNKAKKALELSIKPNVTSTDELKSLQNELRAAIAAGTEAEDKYNTVFGAISNNTVTVVESKINDLKTLLDAQKKELAVDKALSSFFDSLDAEAKKSPLDDYVNSMKESVTAFNTQKDLMQTGLQGLEDSFVSLMTTGSFSFKELASSIIEDIIRYTVRASITLPIANALNEAMSGSSSSSSSSGSFISTAFSTITGMFNAKGNVYKGNASGISKYSNSVVDKPTMFATGGNVMGEAGPEAILPLTRTSSGNLGVETSGNSSTDGSNISFEMNITNKTSKEITAKQESIKFDKASKKMILDVILEAAGNNVGGFRSTMKGVVNS